MLVQNLRDHFATIYMSLKITITIRFFNQKKIQKNY